MEGGVRLSTSTAQALAQFLDLVFVKRPQPIELWKAHHGPREGQLIIVLSHNIGRIVDDESARRVMTSREIWGRHERGEPTEGIVELAAARMQAPYRWNGNGR